MPELKNENKGKKTDGKSKKKTLEIEDMYKSKTLHEHILSAPDTYIGTSLVDEVRMFVYNEDSNKIVEEVINYIAGLFKIFDEILVNARDHTVRDKSCKNIKIIINKQTGQISVYNDGNGIPVAIHKEQKIYIPEMIFGNLLTSQNYDTVGKTVGGKNGYGAKVCMKSGTAIPLYNGELKKIEDIEIGEKLIGDDGIARNVINKTTGDGKLFEITQKNYQGHTYVVNENHILCLRMADHKVIYWSDTDKTWNILWLDKEKTEIRKKSIRVFEKEKIICNECGEELSSNIARHYSRLHPDIDVPKQVRKSPTIIAPDKQEVKDGLVMMKKFAKTITDDNTLDISVKDYVKLNDTTKKRLSGYLGKCVQWKHQDVELDPYVLGLWLGDGYQNGRAFAININLDVEILEYLKNWGLDNDLEIKNTATNAYYYGVCSLSKCRVAPLKKLLSIYNLLDNKHVPKEYLVNSRDVRLKVLAGMIDSDGHVTREGTRINIAQGMNHKQLAEDIIFLARSLGFKVCSQIQNTQWKYEGELRKGEAIMINISGDGVEDIPTKVARKKCCAPVKRDTTGTGCLTVKQVEDGEYVGLAVDGNKRFVLSDFTVIHNCNIYSSFFEVHTIGYDRVDEKNAKKIEYKQVFRNNMFETEKAIINNKISQSSKTFTKITFTPDYERFGMTGLTNDMYNLLIKRCYDIAACTEKTIKISVNDQEIVCRDFKDYIKMYYGNDTKEKPKIVHEKVNSRWEVGIGFSTNVGDRYVSFVNGISTFQGGTHVAHVVNVCVTKIIAHINKKKDYKNIKILATTIKQYLTFFINCVIEDPGFNSQTKEYMNSKISDWCRCGNNCQDVKCDISDDFIDKLCATGLMTEVVKMSEFKSMRELAKTDGKKIGSLRSIEKLDDANWAGGRNSHKTSLFLTEGDSAKSFVIDGISVIGKDCYGVFPLRGKLLNVRNASPKQIKENKEFVNIKQILGLKQGVKYKNVSKLRYGAVIILTDQDPDGSHIKGLLINMLEYFWPELLQIPGFIKAYNTPIVKAWKSTDKNKTNIKTFYSLTEYENWKQSMKDSTGKWEHKYYKGLGTSTGKESKESFYDFDDNLVTFLWEQNEELEDNNEDNEDNEKMMSKLKSDLKKKSEVKKDKDKEKEKDIDEESEQKIDVENENEIENDDDDDDDEETSYAYMKSQSHQTIVKVFDKHKVEERNLWLHKFNPDNVIKYTQKMKVTYTDFFNKDMIVFSNDDNIRSIPSLCDGLKPSQRMILYSCFKRKKNGNGGEVKVAQLAGYVSENTDYHHGETSLQEAIIGVAQNYPGSNNINLLKPKGNFGSRRVGGKDHASARYIFTQLETITPYIYRAEDEEILKYNYDDAKKVEPTYYAPIIPMILVNGARGIGTGASTNIPQYNPKDIVKNMKRMLEDEEPLQMMPWYNGFKGTIEKNPEKDYKYFVRGKYTVDGNKIHISDIPIIDGWIEPYVKAMEAKISITKDDDYKIERVDNNSGNNFINITITFKGQELQKMFKEGTLEKYLSMLQNQSVTNLHLFTPNGKLFKYDNILDIMRDFYVFRIEMYEKRKEYYLIKLQNDLDICKYKVKFIKEYLAGTILIAKKTVVEVTKQLEDKKYPRMLNDHRVDISERSYRYLTDQSILSLTTDRIKELESNREKCQMIYDDYVNMTIKEIWNRELDELLIAYDKWCIEWEDELEINGGNKKNKGKNKNKENDKGKCKGKGKNENISNESTKRSVSSSSSRSKTSEDKNTKKVKVTKKTVLHNE